jgi:hypothetical protein
MFHRTIVAIEQLAIQVTRIPINQHTPEIEHSHKALSSHPDQILSAWISSSSPSLPGGVEFDGLQFGIFFRSTAPICRFWGISIVYRVNGQE